MSAEVTTQAISDALHAAVAEKGEDYIYPGAGTTAETCFYATEDGAPSCIVGHVIAALDPEEFQALYVHEKNTGESLTVSQLIGSKWNDFDLDSVKNAPKWDALTRYSPEAEALLAAQHVQDGGLPWGYAQRAFDQVISGEKSFDDAVVDAQREWREETRAKARKQVEEEMAQ